MRINLKYSLGQAIWVVLGFFVYCSASAQTVRFEPDFRFPGTFFPAFAISSAGKDSKGSTDNAQVAGYPGSASFGVKVFDAPSSSKLKVRITIPEIGVAGELESTASSDGKPKVLLPRLVWSQSRLASISQPLSSEVVFALFVDGTLIGEERRPVRVRAINDAPLQACRTPQQCSDYSQYLAAFVNENNPAIDSILRAALDIPAMPVKKWVGTQRGPEEVLRQVWAIWYLLQRNKVTYSNITTVSDERPDLHSQAVRPMSQTLHTSQANCIDGTALFASILRKIGIEPTIVLIPSHAFLAFSVDGQHTAYLETTMLNDANNPFNQRGPTKSGTAIAKFMGSDPHMQKSWQSFSEALNEGRRKYEKAAPNFGTQERYKMISIKKARESGILPLPL